MVFGQHWSLHRLGWKIDANDYTPSYIKKVPKTQS